MKHLLLVAFISLSAFLNAQTVKSKNLKLKYTLPAGWNAEEFGSKNWEDAGNNMCHCAGIYFFRLHKDGKMNVLVYPSSQAGLDSTKRNFVGTLHFEDVEKLDRIRINALPLERKKSNFTDSKSKAKSFDVFRYFAKVDDRFYIIYAWQENMQPLNSTNENLVVDMVKGIEFN